MTWQTRRSFLKRTGTATSVALMTGLAGCQDGGGGDTISLGAINPLSGPASSFGELATETQGLWAEQVNGDGGLEVAGDTYEVEIIEYDDESTNSEAQAAAERLTSVDEVSAILSSWRSEGALAINDIVQNAQTPTFTHGFTADVNEEGSYLMRLTVSTVMDAYPALATIDESDEIENIGVIAEEGDWGDDTLDLMEWWFEESDHDGTYQDIGRFSFDQQDFSGFITSTRNQYQNGNIDALYVQTWAAAMERFLIQQNREGLNQDLPIFTGLGGADYNNISNVGAAMENVYALALYTRLSYADNEKIRPLIADESLDQFDQYQETGAPNHPTAYNVYANCQATETALKRAEGTSGEQIRDALINEPVMTLLGEVQMEDTGQPQIPGTLIRFGANGDEATIDEVAWNDTLPAITNIPPNVDI